MTALGPQEWAAIGLSLRVAVVATLVALPLAVWVAHILARKSFRGRWLLNACSTHPWRVQLAGVSDCDVAIDRPQHSCRDRPWVCQSAGRVWCHDHLCCSYSGADTNNPVGYLRLVTNSGPRACDYLACCGVHLFCDRCADFVRVAGCTKQAGLR